MIEDSELNEHPYEPITEHSRALALTEGDRLRVAWRHRSERYVEKLATPDTSVADLIGDVDPMRVAEGRRLGDPETIHYGLVPRPTAASSPSTSCPTSPSGSRSRCST